MIICWSGRSSLCDKHNTYITKKLEVTAFCEHVLAMLQNKTLVRIYDSLIHFFFNCHVCGGLKILFPSFPWPSSIFTLFIRDIFIYSISKFPYTPWPLQLFDLLEDSSLISAFTLDGLSILSWESYNFPLFTVFSSRIITYGKFLAPYFTISVTIL